MAIYEFQCLACGTIFEIERKMETGLNLVGAKIAEADVQNSLLAAATLI